MSGDSEDSDRAVILPRLDPEVPDGELAAGAVPFQGEEGVRVFAEQHNRAHRAHRDS